jgi:hypothetical protein
MATFRPLCKLVQRKVYGLAAGADWVDAVLWA